MIENEVDDLKIRLGWLPDYPSIKDFTKNQDKVAEKLSRLGQKDSIKTMLNKVGVLKETPKATLPASVDLRAWCSPVEDQGNLGSCTANAGVGLVEYFERRAFGNHIDASRLFLYKVTRNLLHWKGDTGAFLRSTMEAMVLFGVPPEEYCPYKIADFEVEPSAFLYAFADNYKTIQYYRMDPPGTPKATLLQTIKLYLSAGLPSMFGFTVYNSINQAATTGKIPYPVPTDKVAGGHAIMVVGYDDNITIKNTNPGGVQTKGALLIRNSWGPQWGGMGGYLWLPYDYVLNSLATDWWSLLKNEWINTNQFKV
jgi:C1A family cysteine protease